MANPDRFSLALVSMLFIFPLTAQTQELSPLGGEVRRPVVLHVAFRDASLRQFYLDRVRDLVANFMPGHVYRRASYGINTLRLMGEQSAARHSVMRQLETLLEPHDVIKLLVISTHGSSDNRVTSLQNIGSIRSATGVDHNFRDFFDPIRAHSAHDMSIVLDACETVCGHSLFVRNRVGALIDYFGNEDGTVYGNETSSHVLPTGKTPSQRWAGRIKRIGIYQLLGATTAAALYTYVTGHLGFAISPALFLGSILGLFCEWIRFHSRALDVSFFLRGSLFRFKNGKIMSQERIAGLRERLQIFGDKIDPCANSLFRFAKSRTN